MSFDVMPPAIRAQSAQPAYREPQTLGEAMRWNFVVDLYTGVAVDHRLRIALDANEANDEPSADARAHSALTLTFRAAPDAPSLEETTLAGLHLARPSHSDTTWPAITVRDAYGQPLPLGIGVDVTDGRWYAMPTGHTVSAWAAIELDLTFLGIHAATYERVAVAVSTIDNDRWTSAPAVSPHLDAPVQFPLGVWSAVQATDALSQVFREVFDGHTANRWIGGSAAYERTASGNEPPLRERIPIALFPVHAFDVDPTDGTIARLVDALSSWRQANRANLTAGRMLLDIALLASEHPASEAPLATVHLAFACD